MAIENKRAGAPEHIDQTGPAPARSEKPTITPSAGFMLGAPAIAQSRALRGAGIDSGASLHRIGGVRLTVPCYARGTRILTVTGEVAVEDLRPGDVVITASGDGPALHPIRWIGYRRIDLDCYAEQDAIAVTPIRIRTGAFGPRRPTRDLLLSPGHAVFVTDPAGPLLVPIRCLVNAHTICWEPARGIVIYYHVELDQHDVLLANNLPAESYCDTGNRHEFANGELVQPLANFAAMPAGAPLRLPFLLAGPRVEKLRIALHARGMSGRGRSRRSDRDRPLN